MNGAIEPIIGRYVHVEIDRETYRIYFEENGAGIPLVCLHTAGSDGRQWRYLLARSSKISHHRVRHALARQVQSARSWNGENISSPPRATLRHPSLLRR